MKNARSVIYELLLKMENGAYSNIALDKALSGYELSAEDRRFVSRIFYGVIERRITLDHIISRCGSKPADRLDREVRTVLRMGFYQLLFCDSVPDSAAVNESVKLIKQTKKSGASGYVNALLRGFIRRDKQYELPQDKTEAMSVEYSCRPELVKLLLDSYDEESVVSLLGSSFLPTDVNVRINVLKTDIEGLKASLGADGAECRESNISQLKGSAAEITSNPLGSPEALKAFGDGLFHVQDISSQLCCLAAAPKEGDTVIDMCAAPGGKTFTMAEMMKNSGKIYACELHEKRLGLIRSGAERLGIDCIEYICGDAREHNEKLPLADVVLCDVPCSGLGVFRGKPEIKYKDPAEFARLPEIQLAILENASSYVKSGGTLVYSTCTVNPAENDSVAEKFLEKHTDFCGEPFFEDLGVPFGGFKATIFPKDFGSDGFFICKMVRK